MGTLRESTALVAGVGGLGAPAALALAAAGVGRLVLLDGAVVAPADLAASPLAGGADLGAWRAPAAARHLSALFPGARIEAHTEPVDAPGVLPALVGAADVVVSATGRAEAAFAVNDAAVAAGTPLVHGGVGLLMAQLLTVVPGVTGCLRCLFEGPPRDGAPAGAAPGAIAPLAGLAGGLLGAEALRLLEGQPGAYAGRLLVHEARTGRSRSVSIPPRAGCAACRLAGRPAPACAVGAP